MFDALYISATGMQAQQLHVDTIANNLANVGTSGFKKAKVAFTDLMVKEAARIAPSADGAGMLGGETRVGAGVAISAVSKLFDMGDLKKTESAFDLAIQGEGFLEVTLPDGTSAYTRGGSLSVNRDGVLATAAGHPIKPALTVPDNAENLSIDGEGHVRVQVAGQTTPVDLGQLDMVRFASPAGLLSEGGNLYLPTEKSGAAIAARPAQDGLGSFAQGYLEGSNVKLPEEMVNLMVAQRVYEANVKVVQAADDMLGMINALRK